MKAVVLFSGGMDSTVLLAKVLAEYGVREIMTISVNYGQRHDQELQSAAKILAYYKLPDSFLVELNIFAHGNLQFIPGSSQTDNSIEVPEGHYADASMRSTFVPNRNMMMLSVASACAIGHGASEVYYGAHKGDHTIYPDCRAPFVYAMNETLRVGNYEGKTCEIIAPFLQKSKADICTEGAALGVPFALTYSCYKGGEKQCGKCGTCMERREAFELARVADPTEYTA